MRGGAGSVWSSSLEQIGDTYVIHVAGEIDLSTAPKFQQVLGGLPAGMPIIIEFSGVEYLDLAGVHALDELCARTPHAGRSIILAGLPPQVRRVLDLVGMTRTLRVTGTVEEAFQMLHRISGEEAPD